MSVKDDADRITYTSFCHMDLLVNAFKIKQIC
jgi:hypothetical protein